MNPNLLLMYLTGVLIFVAVAMLIYGIGKLFSEFLISKRIKHFSKSIPKKSFAPIKAQSSSGKLKNYVGALYKLSLPAQGWQNSDSRLKFIRAGFRDNSAPSIYFSSKTLLFFAFPLVFSIPFVIFSRNLNYSNFGIYLLGFAALGYYVPDIYLSGVTKKRMQEMQDHLADFIDLLVMCTASGLGLDSALNRVSLEMSKSSPTLSEEFYLACLEIRAGSGRVTALKNLATRVNIEDLKSLVAMLVQADKFGSSLASSMRIHSEFMRVKRVQRAEEIAAKIPVKMLLPLVLFIFPTLLIVLIGPAAIRMSEGLFK